MRTAPDVPSLTQDPAVTQITQRELFDEPAAPAKQAAGLFAELVFDRPLDHAYTYAVPERLRDEIAVGKRVLAPFGKGDRNTAGYCVHLTERAPDRAVKEIVRVLDTEPLLTPSLLRLTRWMADYYLCGWGQVLNAVVPAGARDQSGTKATVFLDALPEDEWPQPPPKLTAKQSAALEVLRRHGKPVELRRLGRLAKCGPGPVESLAEKGVARRLVRRVETFDLSAGEGLPEPSHVVPVELNADQQKAWAALEQSVRRGGF